VAGARKLLVANAPNLGKVPVVAALGAQAPAEQLSDAYNMALDGLLAQLAHCVGRRSGRQSLAWWHTQ